MPAASRTAVQLKASIFAELAPCIEAYARRGGDLVGLHIGDTHLPPPPAARFASVEGAEFDADLYRYGAISGLEALKEAFAARLAAQGFGPPADAASSVLVACGATHALFCAARAVFDPGDEVLVATPYWPLSVGVLHAAGAVAVEVPITTRLYAEPTLVAGVLFEQALTSRTRGIYLATPNNPDGKVLSEVQLASVARLAQEHDLWVLADEVYADYVYEGAHLSMARLPGMAARTLTVYSLSKSHSLAGARVGFLVGPEPVVSVARRVATHTVFNVPVGSQRVALGALKAPAEWMSTAVHAYREARDATLEALGLGGSNARIRAFVPDGGSYVFVDFSEALDGRPLKVLLERAIEHGVLLAPGDGCGAAFGGWARLCFTSVPRRRVLEGVGRLKEALREL